MDAYDADSVAALIIAEDGRYLLQHRDDLPQVDFRGMWGLFGGGIDMDETPEAALLRELREELGLEPRAAEEFGTLIIQARFWSDVHARRRYFTVPIEVALVAKLTLREGQGMQLFARSEITASSDAIIPYDLCAIMLHRLASAPQPAFGARGR